MTSSLVVCRRLFACSNFSQPPLHRSPGVGAQTSRRWLVIVSRSATAWTRFRLLELGFLVGYAYNLIANHATSRVTFAVQKGVISRSIRRSARKTRPILPDDSRRGGCSRGCSGVRRSRRCTGHYRRRCRFAPFDGCRLYAARAEQSYCPDQEKNSDHCAISRKLTANER